MKIRKIPAPPVTGIPESARKTARTLFVFPQRKGVDVVEKTVLYIVDASGEFATLIGTLFGTDAVSIECYASAEAFLEGYRPSRRALLILDPSFQGASGLDLLQILRSRGHVLPTICVAYASRTMSSALTCAGVLEHFERPFDSRLVSLRLDAQGLLASTDGLDVNPSPASSLDMEGAGFAARLERLTPREREVAGLVGQGHSSF
jgi:FixJ family two-component response regulator